MSSKPFPPLESGPDLAAPGGRSRRRPAAAEFATPTARRTTPAAAFVYPQAPDPRVKAKTPEGDEPETRESIESEALTRGRLETEARLRAELDRALRQERASIGIVVGGFARARANYFLRIEGEVVRLALAVARRVLRREAALDPAVLSAAVRNALDQLDAATVVKLRVHPSRAHLWEGALRSVERGMTPQVLQDPSLSVEQCRLETDLGSTELDLDGPLAEIDQAFRDLREDRARLADESEEEQEDDEAGGSGAAK